MLAPRSLLAAIAVLAGLLVGCGGDDSETPEGSKHPDGGGPDAGIDGPPCQPGEIQAESGDCQAAGVATCAKGFEADGKGGCNAVLPSAPCAAGQMAVPGETACRAVMACSGKWGEAPVDASTEYVDAAYTGGGSDGTEAKPWTTIQAAIDAAAPGAVVAVAAGSYTEDLSIKGQGVRLWGACPGDVEIVGTGTLAAVLAEATGAELHGLAVRGPAIGIVISDAEDVVLDRIWVHDTGGRGIDAENTLGAAKVTIQGVLVEATRNAGVIVLGTEAKIEGSVVRSGKPDAALHLGRGIVVRQAPGSSVRANASVTGSLVEQNRDNGIYVHASDLTVDATLVRDILSNSVDGKFGRGISVEYEPTTGEEGTATVGGSVVERASSEGFYVAGSTATIESTVIRATQPQAGDDTSGMGLDVEDGPSPETRAHVTMKAGVIEDNVSQGANVMGSELTMEATIVRGTQAAKDSRQKGMFGRGVNVEVDPRGINRGTLVMTGCVVEKVKDHGIFIGGSDGTITSTAVRDIDAEELTGNFGRGIVVQAGLGQRGAATISFSTVERVHDVAIGILGGDGILEGVTISDTLPRVSDNGRGRGLGAQYVEGTAELSTLSVKNSVIERSYDVGVTLVFTTATFENTVVRDTLPRASDGTFGDGLIINGGSVDLQGVRIENSARVGIGSFDGDVHLGGSVLECNKIHLDGEKVSTAPNAGPTFEDLGGNVCGCKGEVVECTLLSSNLSAPEEL